MLAGHLLDGGDVAGAVVVADGNHAKPLSKCCADDHRRRHGVVCARRERGVDVQVCQADVHAWVPFSPRAYRRPTMSKVSAEDENSESPSAAALSRTSSSGRRPPANTTAASSA